MVQAGAAPGVPRVAFGASRGPRGSDTDGPEGTVEASQMLELRGEW